MKITINIKTKEVDKEFTLGPLGEREAQLQDEIVINIGREKEQEEDKEYKANVKKILDIVTNDIGDISEYDDNF